MRRRTRNVICMSLVVAMVVSILPMQSAYAEEEIPIGDITLTETESAEEVNANPVLSDEAPSDNETMDYGMGDDGILSDNLGMASDMGSESVFTDDDNVEETVDSYDEGDIILCEDSEQWDQEALPEEPGEPHFDSEDGGTPDSNDISLSTTEQIEIDSIETVDVVPLEAASMQEDSVSSVLADFSLEKFIADLYCDSGNTVYYGTLMRYLDRSNDSPADVVVKGLEEDQGFAATAAAWEAATFDPSNIVGDALSNVDYYEAILIAMMEVSVKSSAMESINDALGVAYIKQIKSIIDKKDGSGTFSDILQKKNYTDADKSILTEGLTEWLKKNGSTLNDANAVVDQISSALSAGQDAASLLMKTAEYWSLYSSVSDAQKEFLSQMYQNCPGSNIALQSALAKLSSCCSSNTGAGLAVFSQIIEKGSELVYSTAVGELWDGMISGTPAGIILFSQKLTQGFMNLLFATDETVEQYYKLKAMCQIEDLVQLTVRNMITNYQNDPSLENAKALISAVPVLFSLYNVNCDYTNTYADIVATKGLLGVLISDKDKYREFKDNVETIRENAKQAQTTLATEYLTFLKDDLPEVYEELGIEPGQPKYVPVLRIDYQDNITVDMSSTFPVPDIVIASVYPPDATDKTLTYTSGDESILTVDEDGIIHWKKAGKTTITIHAADGVSAVVNVTVIEGEKEADKDEEGVLASGNCGENVTWRLEKDGTLYIDGTGEMEDYSVTDYAPWSSEFYEQRYALKPLIQRYIERVVIAEGITKIGAYSFGYNIYTYGHADIFPFLESVSLPKSLTEIGEYAFSDCPKLTEINLPEGMTSISDYAFADCSGLRSIGWSERLTSIGDYAFHNCDNLNSITLPEGVSSIGDYAFYNCNNLTSVSLPEGLNYIGERAFVECSSLSSINLPKGLISIEGGTFGRCNSLKSIRLPEGLESIGDYAFAYCSLTSINLPEGLTSIDDRAFEGCSNLSSVKVPRSVIEIGTNAFGYADDGDTKLSNFTVIGEKGSAAETYALENGFLFIDVNGTSDDHDMETEKNPSGDQEMEGNPSGNQNMETEKVPSVNQGAETEKSPSGIQASDKKVTAIKFAASSLSVQKGKTLQLSLEILPGDAANKSLKWTTGNSEIATVNDSGMVTGKNYGTTSITVAAQDGSGLKAVCEVTVGYGLTYKLNGGENDAENPAAHYKTAVALKNPERKGYLFKGWYTDKKCKKKLKKVAANSRKDITVYAKWEKVSVGRPGIQSLKNSAKKKATLKIPKVSKAAGYQIIYSTDKKFRKNCRTSTTKKTSATLKGLEKGKKYYVKVRAYKIDSTGGKVYGKYSPVKSVKVKR